MNELIERLSVIVPLIAIGFVVILTLLNLFFKIRVKFPKAVNCWFCNENTSVPYQQKNCWVCPACDQYNGFSEDGDYNRDIPAQRNVRLNGPSSVFRDSTSLHSLGHTTTNGLCTLCNRNQEIKIQQLATFLPESEDTFDEEMEEFRKKLEQSYRLCFRCERILNRTLNKVKQNILGSKLAQIGAQGMSILDRHMAKTSKLIATRKMQIFTKISLAILAALALQNFVEICQSLNLTKAKFDVIFHPKITHIFLVILSFASVVQLLFLKLLNQIQSVDIVVQTLNVFHESAAATFNWITEKFSEFEEEKQKPTIDELKPKIFDFFAICLVVFLLILNGLKRKNGLILVLLLWSIKMVFPAMETHVNGTVDTILIEFLKIAISFLTCILSVSNLMTSEDSSKPAPDKQSVNNSFHRIYSENNSDQSDVDSDEDTDYLSISKHSIKSSQMNRTKSPVNTCLNTSFDSTKSMTESLLNSTLFRHGSSNFNTSFNPKCGSCMQNNQFGGSQESLFGSNQSSVSQIHRLKTTNASVNDLNTSHNPIYWPKYDAAPARKFSSMSNGVNYCHNRTFQDHLAELNISTANTFNGVNRLHLMSSPSLLMSPQSPPSIKHRKELILPARLNLSDQVLIGPHAPLTQASWIAGGYWNNSTSPQQKKVPSVMQPPLLISPLPAHVQQDDLLPILSRTSSQSSGFESRASSVLNGFDNRSREGSICPPDTFDIGCLSESTSQIGIHNPSISISDLNSSSSKHLIAPSIASYKSFDMQRKPLHNRAASTCSFNFKKFTNDLPPIEQGSLLRTWKQNSLLNLSQNL